MADDHQFYANGLAGSCLLLFVDSHFLQLSYRRTSRFIIIRGLEAQEAER
jgi:hypothetical protein